MKRTVATLVLALLTTTAAVAQDAELRGSGGLIKVVTKQAKPFSGSLGITTSGSTGYEATLGGAVVTDRLWFFASAQQNTWQLSAPESVKAFDTKWAAQLGERNSVGATTATLPSSFLSLRFDSVLSSNTFFRANVSRTKGTTPLVP